MEARTYRGIAYRMSGRGKKTILLVHGLSGSSSAWREYERHFHKRYRVISVDLRGHGRSFRPTSYDDFAMDLFSQDIAEVLEHEHVRSCILVAHSFGTLIALDLLMHSRVRVSKAVLVSPEYAPARHARLVKPLLSLARAVNILPTIRKRGGHIDYRKYVGTGDWNLRRSYADVTNTGVKSYVNALCHAYAYDATEGLKRIHIPVLIVHGERDTIFPVSIARSMAALLPRATLTALPQADHIIVLNHFSDLSRAIDEFL